MNLKDAFRAQNKLQALMDEAGALWGAVQSGRGG